MLADAFVQALPFEVWVWNGEHTKRKLFKAYASQIDADLTVKALRVHGLDAVVVRPKVPAYG